jgi:excisionase family DNA binding protein
LRYEGAGMEIYFNTKELGEYLHIPEQTIRRWVLKNEIPYHRIHNVIRYRISEIEKWVDEHKEKVPALENEQSKNKLFDEPENADSVEQDHDTKEIEE